MGGVSTAMLLAILLAQIVWQIEGLATYEESKLTSGGRLHAD